MEEKTELENTVRILFFVTMFNTSALSFEFTEIGLFSLNT